MSDALARLLDLETAWKRVKADIPERVFVRHPCEIQLIEQSLQEWLSLIGDCIQNDQYNPSPIVICDVPKAKGGVRPGGHLSMIDRVVYAASVGACYNNIHRSLAWAQDIVDYSYRLSTESTSVEWLRNQFRGWSDFRSKSLARIAAGATYVVVADIAGYYENIDIATIVSDLKQTGAPVEAVNQLSSCLNRWAQVPGRGIPQGHSPSDILGKLYLNSIDQNLRAMGYDHYRYVDDIRIFCKSRTEAKKALVDLAIFLRKRGLSLQPSKTEILSAESAGKKIDDVQHVIREVRFKVIAKAIAVAGLDNPYISLGEAEEILKENAEDLPLEIIREVYRTYFLESTDVTFNKTLFHFLLTRFGKYGDSYAVEHCKGMFEAHPEETRYILKYFSSVGVAKDVEPTIVTFLESEDAIYPYQVYQIIEWAQDAIEGPSPELISIGRRLAFDSSQPRYLRSVCRGFIGKFGTTADLERLEHSYSDAAGTLEQSEIIFYLRRMESGRRNSFLGRAQSDGHLNRNAARLVRNVTSRDTDQ